MIQVKHVNKQFGEKKALNDISLTIKKGEVVALVGPNGAGKTTLISILLGLITPDSGTVRTCGVDPITGKQKQITGAMLQESFEVPQLKVKEAFDLFRSYYENPKDTEQLLQLANLSDERNQFTHKLSGGQKRRLSFGIAMAGNPELIFLDEPTTGMDTISRQKFWQDMQQLADQGKTIVLTTHYLEEVEKFAERIILLKDGSIIHDGSLKELEQQFLKTKISLTYFGGKVVSWQSLSGVSTYQVEETGEVSLTTTCSDETVIDLVEQKIPFKDLRIQATTLDEIFTTLITK